MKKLNLLLLLAFAVMLIGENVFSQTATSILLPQYIQGVNGTNNNRIPFVFRAKLDGLLPNATYRYINQVVLSTDGATTAGAGNVFFVNSNIDSPFVRTSSPDMNLGPYGTLTTDASGSYTGWFITEPTGNATRFVPGKYIFMRIRLNDGAGGTTAATYLTLPDSVKVINLYTAATDTSGTAIFGQSTATSKDFVFLYDNVAGTGRPVSSAIVENDGLNISAVTSFAIFYRDSVDNKVGYWGSIIPNVFTNGVRRIERRLFTDGSLHPIVATDADGLWPSGVNTVNPTGGTTALRVDITDAPLPVELVSFSAKTSNGSIILNWATATETNNSGFQIERKLNGSSDWTVVTFVKGKGTTTEVNNYSFIDKSLGVGKYSYRLKQIDFNGEYEYSAVINADINAPNEYTLYQNYPNPFNPLTTIEYSLPEKADVTISIYTALGELVTTLVNASVEAGYQKVSFNASSLTSGTYIYQIKAVGSNKTFTDTKKMLLMK